MAKRALTARKKAEPTIIEEELQQEGVYFDEELYVRTSSPHAQMAYAGVPVMLINRNTLFDILFSSEWFKQRTLKQLREAPLEVLVEGVPRYTIRVATKQDVIDLATQGIRETTLERAVEKDKARRAGTETTIQHDDGTVTVRPPKAARTPKVATPGAVGRSRKGSVEFAFTLPTGKALENRLANMPKQARILMEIASAAGQERMNGEALDAVLQAGAPAKGVLPKIVPLVLQRFKAFIRDGAYDGLVTKEEAA